MAFNSGLIKLLVKVAIPMYITEGVGLRTANDIKQ